MSEQDLVIKFDAAVYKTQTLADGGIRVVLDMAGENVVVMAALAKCQVDGIPLTVECTPIAVKPAPVTPEGQRPTKQSTPELDDLIEELEDDQE